MGSDSDQLTVSVSPCAAAVQTAAPDGRIAALLSRLDASRMPTHIAIVMDGNGRWAKENRLPSRLLGHRQGYKAAKQIVRDAADMGVKVLTLYVFSNENWRRPRHEVEGLMALYEQAIRNELSELHENSVRMRFVGRRDGLSASLLREIDRATELTAGNDRITLNLALNYGGRAEIVDACRLLAAAAARGEIDPASITEADIAAHTYSPELPDPDLVIRTAGECRISNFLLWGVAYAEIWVTKVYWPDFTADHLADAIADYQRRVRKFGAVATE